MASYWMERQQNKAYKTASRVNKQLEKTYKTAYKSINKQIEKVWLDMLTEGEITPGSIYKNGRLKAIMREVEKQLGKLGIAINKDLQLSLLDTFNNTWLEANKQLGAETSFNAVNSQLAKEIVNSSFKNAVYSDRVWTNLKEIQKQIEKTIVDTAITGKDVRTASRRLAERMGVSLNDAQRITIAETDRVLQESCRQTALARGYKTYSIIVESDACEECKDKFADKHFEIGESVLPAHPFCKCCMKIDI